MHDPTMWLRINSPRVGLLSLVHILMGACVCIYIYIRVYIWSLLGVAYFASMFLEGYVLEESQVELYYIIIWAMDLKWFRVMIYICKDEFHCMVYIVILKRWS